ncbi:Gfo/Idh/MocA family oxidoreductase [Geodermatophilus sp. CPCC 206100]|uniref:Gfo/Idh/MocA family oxidoreductase n=1 Tax=Geodermatophilus sp. CPCC 206100 TaxID=3020054 RepID=UPI003B0078A7
MTAAQDLAAGAGPTLRVGVAGAGRIGEVHVRSLAGLAAVGEVVLFDPDPDRVAALAAAHGAVPVASVDALFAAGLDALVIASPAPTHADLLERALAAGLPTFCEKPVAADVAETERLAGLARDSGCPVQVGFHYRFDPALRALASAAPERLALRVHSTTEFAPSAEYLAGAGGIVADKLVHELDMVRWMTGSEVAAVAAMGPGPDPLSAALVLHLSDGTLATVWGAYRSAAGFDLVVEAETPTRVLVVGNRRQPDEDVAVLAPSTVTDFRDRFAAAYVAEMAAFVDLAVRGGPNPCSLDEAVRTQRLVSAVQGALARREVVVVEDGR